MGTWRSRNSSAVMSGTAIKCAACLILCLLFIHPPAHGSEVSPAARNTLDSARIPRASKLLICGLFLKGRVLAQDGIGSALLSRETNLYPAVVGVVSTAGSSRSTTTNLNSSSNSTLLLITTPSCAKTRPFRNRPQISSLDALGIRAESRVFRVAGLASDPWAAGGERQAHRGCARPAQIGCGASYGQMRARTNDEIMQPWCWQTGD